MRRASGSSGTIIEAIRTRGGATCDSAKPSINGRLIGALSYAWGFSKEPICGITPIEDMLRLSKASHLEGANTEMDSGSGSPSKLSHNLPIVPLGTILMVNGFDNSILEQMKNIKTVMKQEVFSKLFIGTQRQTFLFGSASR